MNADRTFRTRIFGGGLVAAAAGWWLASVGSVLPGVALCLAGLVVAAGTVWLRVRPRSRSNAAIGRWDRRSRRHHGTASRWDILKTSSAWAMRRKAAVVRPSLRPLSRLARWRAPLLS